MDLFWIYSAHFFHLFSQAVTGVPDDTLQCYAAAELTGPCTRAAMNSPVARKLSLYEQLLSLPEGLTGEIINGQLRTQPRPAWPHILASARLGTDIEGSYGRGRGGPGGWWIVLDPEVHFALDIEVTVPDIAGWRKERMPSPPEGHKIQVVPDWVCEIFSPSTKSTDR